MGLSPRLLLKSSFGSSGAGSDSSRAASPSPSMHSTQSVNSSGSLNSATTGGALASSFNGQSRIGPSPIATHSYGLYSSASFSSVQSTDSYGNGAASQQKSAEEILRMVSEQKLCVVRKHGAQEETLINSIVDGIARAADVLPLYLHVTQKAAGRLLDATQRNGLPLIYLNGDLIGGLGELRALSKSEFAVNALQPHDYDFIVVGATAGGIAAATEASALGRKVILIDLCSSDIIESDTASGASAVYDHGVARRLLCEIATHKLMLSALVKSDTTNSWRISALREIIRTQAQQINEHQRRCLDDAQVRVLNARHAHFCGTHEIDVQLVDGRQQQFGADKFLIALAGETARLGFPCDLQSHSISLADFFAQYLFDEQLDSGVRLLCVGDERRALELAAIACAFGHSTTVLSSPDAELRGIGAEFKTKLRNDLTRRGIRIQTGTVLKCERPTDDTRGSLLRVHIQPTAHEVSSPSRTVVENYDLLVNCDDSAQSAGSAVDSLNVRMLEVKSGAKSANIWPPNVHTLCEKDNAKLARHLVRRLYDGYLEALDSHEVAASTTVVATPISYASCGLSIEQAISKFGADSLIVYSGEFDDITHHAVSDGPRSGSYLCKIVCLLLDQERVLGAELFAPNAALLIDVFSLAVKLEARRYQLDSFVGAGLALTEIIQCLKPVSVEVPIFTA